MCIRDRLGDVFVEDAFGSVHRAHASTAGIPAHLPSAAGFLVEKEIAYIGKAVSDPERPMVAILGGAKVSDKILVIENLLKIADKVIVGGGMTYTFMKAMGHEIGNSLVEDDRIDVAKEIIEKGGDKLILPVDSVINNAFAAEGDIKVCGEDIPEGYMGLDTVSYTHLDVYKRQSLNRPYIPGSTIKGAIINAIYFYFLKQKINDAIEYIKKEKNVKNLFNYLYGNEFEEAMTLYSSSLICRDIYFNDQSLILCHSQRLNMNKGQDFYDYECIDYNKEVEGEFISIDLIKKDLFQKRFPKYYKLFKPLFNIDNIFVTIRNYYNRVLNNDVEYFEEYGKNLGINYPRCV